MSDETTRGPLLTMTDEDYADIDRDPPGHLIGWWAVAVRQLHKELDAQRAAVAARDETIARLEAERDAARKGLFHRITGWDKDGQTEYQILDELQESREQVTALARERDALLEAIRVVRLCVTTERDGQFWPARKWLDDRAIFNGDLTGLRVVEAVCEHLLSKALEQARDTAPGEGER